MSEKYPCPVCGFLVLAEPPGSYDICAICDWEDDHVQLAFPDLRGGANKGSLKDYQDRILKEIPIEVKQYKGFQRDPEWRPLYDDEIQSEQNIQSGSDYFHAAVETVAKYYWKTKL
jgi:hypothetical protein